MTHTITEVIMYAYPLRLDVGSWTTTDHLRLRDAAKQTVLCGEPPHDNQPYVLRVSQENPRVLCQISPSDDADGPRFAISAANGAALGALRCVGKGQWSVLDERGEAAGSITQKNRWRESSLYDFFTTHPSFMDAMFVLFFPFQYDVVWRGQPVLRLREKDWEVTSHRFQLTKLGGLTDAEELLLLASLAALFWEDQ